MANYNNDDMIMNNYHLEQPIVINPSTVTGLQGRQGEDGGPPSISATFNNNSVYYTNHHQYSSAPFPPASVVVDNEGTNAVVSANEDDVYGHQIPPIQMHPPSRQMQQLSSTTTPTSKTSFNSITKKPSLTAEVTEKTSLPLSTAPFIPTTIHSKSRTIVQRSEQLSNATDQIAASISSFPPVKVNPKVEGCDSSDEDYADMNFASGNRGNKLGPRGKGGQSNTTRPLLLQPHLEQLKV